jgi:hypothetical protein
MHHFSSFQTFTALEGGIIICACSNHGQSRYQIWIKCDKRQTTSCVHKMCERTFFVWPYGPSAHLVYATSHSSFVGFYSYLVYWLAMIWDAHIILISWIVDLLSQKSTIRAIGIICACTNHGQSRFQIWIKCDKRQMISCVHKMYEWTYGQTNMKRAITLAKVNHPWNRYNMRMLRSWPAKIPNMNKMRQKTND